MIIAISGKIGSGKDTIAKIIQGLIQFYKEGTQKHNPTAFVEAYLRSENILPQEDENGNRYTTVSFKSEWQVKKFAGKLKQIVSLLTGYSLADLEKQEIKDTVLGEEWRRWYWNHYKVSSKKTTKYFISKVEALAYKESLDETAKFVCKDLHSEIPTVRMVLQELGTEALREVIHPNVHINALFVDYKEVVTKIQDLEDTGNWNPLKFKDFGIYVPKLPDWLITDMRFPNELTAVHQRDGMTIRTNRPQLIPREFEHESETALDDFKDFDYIITNDGTIEQLIEKVKAILIREEIIRE
jgi:energy-coupling factor transporter ATP-binding protein EcfA2